MRYLLPIISTLLLCSSIVAQPDQNVAQQVSQDDLRAWIKQLGAESFRTRQLAEANLSKVGWRALAALRVAAKHKTLEHRLRAVRLIALIEGRDPQKQTTRTLLSQLLADKRFTPAQRIDAICFVCFGRIATEKERGEVAKHLSRAGNNSSKIQTWFDSLLYHADFNKDLAQLNWHVRRLIDDMIRAVDNPTSTPAGAVPYFNDKFMRSEIAAAGRALAQTKSSLTDQQWVNAMFLMTLHRYPTQEQIKLINNHLRKQSSRTEALGDILWALVNCKEFVDCNRHNASQSPTKPRQGCSDMG